MTGEPLPAPRPAASIVILRDGTRGIEVLMLRRHQAPGVAFSGATVFPGGKVDTADGQLATAAALQPATPFWIAAIRETFEEAGLLIARPQEGDGLVDGATTERLITAARSRGHDVTSASFARMLASERLVPALDHLVHFGHWITPPWEKRRFDTHFFLVGLPPGQTDRLDLGESADGGWLRPAEVLAEADGGARTLVAVTRFSLELIMTWPDVRAALAAARQRRIVTVIPEAEAVADGRILRVPKDAGYPRHEMFIRRRPA